MELHAFTIARGETHRRLHFPCCPYLKEQSQPLQSKAATLPPKYEVIARFVWGYLVPPYRHPIRTRPRSQIILFPPVQNAQRFDRGGKRFPSPRSLETKYLSNRSSHLRAGFQQGVSPLRGIRARETKPLYCKGRMRAPLPSRFLRTSRRAPRWDVQMGSVTFA